MLRDRYVDALISARYPGYYETGDAGYIDDNGYIFVMARTDDVINVAGHRLSTGAMEEVLADHPDVAECAPWSGVADAMKGQLPLGLLVLNAGVERDPAGIVSELIAQVREKSARWPRSNSAPWSSGCPKRGPARFCVAPCAASPMGNPGSSRRP